VIVPVEAESPPTTVAGFMLTPISAPVPPGAVTVNVAGWLTLL
jgi:hypothetical protein